MSLNYSIKTQKYVKIALNEIHKRRNVMGYSVKLNTYYLII